MPKGNPKNTALNMARRRDTSEIHKQQSSRKTRVSVGLVLAHTRLNTSQESMLHMSQESCLRAVPSSHAVSVDT
eukprot:1309516-Amphidinium_carterae.1